MKLSWLHLTDLHLELVDREGLWEEIKPFFYDDLREQLRELREPLDLILFSGDLVKKGDEKEFAQFASEMLELQNTVLTPLGSKPHFLSVPGNHDLNRPSEVDLATTYKEFVRLNDLEEFQRRFWNSDTESEDHQFVQSCFKNYSDWWTNDEKNGVKRPAGLLPGVLPGDFAVRLEKHGIKYGVIGLNSTAFQLASIPGDDENSESPAYKGKLTLHSRQISDLLPGNAVDWFQNNLVNILLSHQPKDWLTPEAQIHFIDRIMCRGQSRFAVHLFGHMHEGEVNYHFRGPDVEWGSVQGHSLFGIGEKAKELDRIHGYSLGEIEFLTAQRNKVTIRPKRFVEEKHKRYFAPVDTAPFSVDYPQLDREMLEFELDAITKAEIENREKRRYDELLNRDNFQGYANQGNGLAALASEALEAFRVDGAIRLYNAALRSYRLERAVESALVGIANCYIGLGDAEIRKFSGILEQKRSMSRLTGGICPPEIIAEALRQYKKAGEVHQKIAAANTKFTELRERQVRSTTALHKSLGDLAAISGDVNEAIAQFTKALTIYKEVPEESLIFPLKLCRANCEAALAELKLVADGRPAPDVPESYQAVETCYRDVGGQLGGRIAIGLGNCMKANGVYLLSQGEKDQARRCFHDALTIYGTRAFYHVGMIFCSLAATADRERQFEIYLAWARIAWERIGRFDLIGDLQNCRFAA